MTSTAALAPEPPSVARAAFGRIVAMAARLFDVPAAVVLTRDYDGWRVTACQGDADGHLTEELLRHVRLLETKEELVLIPDLDEHPGLAPGVPLTDTAPAAEAWRLRFLAAAAYRDSPKAARPAGCLCLLDSRPRQLRTEDRRLLAELAAVVSDEAGLMLPAAFLPPLQPLAAELAAEPSSPAPQSLRRTADLTALVVPRYANGAANDGDLAARVEELTRLNESLRAEIDGQGDELSRVRLEQLIEEKQRPHRPRHARRQDVLPQRRRPARRRPRRPRGHQAHARHRLPHARGQVVLPGHGRADAHAHGPLGGRLPLPPLQDGRVRGR